MSRRPQPLALPGFGHVHRYWDRYHEVHAAKILPGQYYVTRGAEAIVTVLGSCVAACVRDVSLGIGGMNHFMLPVQARDDAGPTPLSEAARYGNHAMELLINGILSNGGDRRSLEVKLFGGGNIISNMTDVGRRNIEFAADYVRAEGLRLVIADVGGVYPRKVCYFPATGRAMVKKLRARNEEAIAQQERRYLSDLARIPVAGEIDLF